MANSTEVFSLPRWRLTQWLVDPGRPVTPEIRQALVSNLFGSLSVFVGGVINTVLVAVLIASYLQRPPFYMWAALEILICTSRIMLLVASRRMARAGRRTPTDWHLVLGLAWAGSIGTGTYLSITSGSWLAAALACLSAAAMVGGLCFRNFAAPRMTGVMILLVLGPCVAGAIAAGEPLFMLTLIQLPVYVISMTSAAFRMNAMLIATMESERESDHRARHDPLTGLPNRASLLHEIQRMTARLRETHQRLAVFYLDLDGFKHINDMHGHGSGDEVLKLVAERIRGVLRAPMQAFRIGGDEFVLLVGEAERNDLQLLAQRLLRVIQMPYTLPNGLQVRIGSSIGIAHIEPQGQTPDTILEAADQALYIAKSRGKGRFHFAEAS